MGEKSKDTIFYRSYIAKLVSCHHSCHISPAMIINYW
jgi:hypothetical protein